MWFLFANPILLIKANSNGKHVWKSKRKAFLKSFPHGSSLIKSPLHHILNLSNSSLLFLFFSPQTKPKNGEILKGAWSSTNTRMEGGLCQLPTAQEIHQNHQTQNTSQPITAPQTNLWSFHFRFSSLPNQQPLQFTQQQQHARYHSGKLCCMCVFWFVLFSMFVFLFV